MGHASAALRSGRMASRCNRHRRQRRNKNNFTYEIPNIFGENSAHDLGRATQTDFGRSFLAPAAIREPDGWSFEPYGMVTMDSLGRAGYPRAHARPLHINTLAAQLRSHGRSVRSGSPQWMPATFAALHVTVRAAKSWPLSARLNPVRGHFRLGVLD
jgi:hypothetical protein